MNSYMRDYRLTFLQSMYEVLFISQLHNNGTTLQLYLINLMSTNLYIPCTVCAAEEMRWHNSPLLLTAGEENCG
jgi:hypothetical protein